MWFNLGQILYKKPNFNDGVVEWLPKVQISSFIGIVLGNEVFLYLKACILQDKGIIEYSDLLFFDLRWILSIRARLSLSVEKYKQSKFRKNESSFMRQKFDANMKQMVFKL